MELEGRDDPASFCLLFSLGIYRVRLPCVKHIAHKSIEEEVDDRSTVSRDIYPNLSIAISKIYKDGGIGPFNAGISPTLMGMLPYSTCSYFMHETMKTSYCEAKNKKSLNRPEMLLVGASAGFTASTLSFPLEVARKRLMVGALLGKCPPHMAAALSEVIREEGLRGLYRGWGATCLKPVFTVPSVAEDEDLLLLQFRSIAGELRCGRRLVVVVVTNGSAVEALWEFTGGARWWLDGRSVDGVKSGLL
uniref:Putative mitochondrial adenine nucleotide transporter BTL1 isoform X2 n=1 Tax=Populus alba TaxID=43335 RepID=A0A4V6AC25_POPAL|nr:putative mitochondrial adenine nucleotide transporter BTL1 isoform X2 [Populus alba]